MERRAERWRWRPEPGWLWLSLLGLTTGAFVGAVLAVVVVLVDVFGAGALAGDAIGIPGAVLGLGVFGALLGGGVGFVLGGAVGVVLMLLVGRRMPGRAPAVLAFVGAAATVVVLARPVLAPFLRVQSDVVTVLISASGVIAGLVAVWFRAQLPRPPAEERTSRPVP
ncbi:hypothetical protein IEZ26_10895 [Nocardioides cavernae]|uniref:Uncharacterized protein n=1 Tax=Nocardioides cavernae TaxID=1921566 RepID=A0ABR8NAG7_9ACTN|nr:hypothetical protein [Nocardioides cavernae]MBD3925130.1 hypothetical protein [Nocardioides cavernae]MBM7514493.1 hypothetical protein [Nocardioides cavernae]